MFAVSGLHWAWKLISVWSGLSIWLLSCSLSAWPVPGTPIPYSHDWPSHILAPGPSYWWVFLSVGQWGSCASASFPGNQWANLISIAYNWPSSLPQSEGRSHIQSTIHNKQWGVTPRPCFRHVRSPHIH